MKVIKRVRMNHMPMDRWDDFTHNYVHATGYAVVFDEGGCEIEYEDSDFEYSPDCETIEDGESYKKEERERKMKEEQENNKPGEGLKKLHKMERIKKLIQSIIGIILMISGNSLYREKERKLWKVVLSFSLYIGGLFSIADSVKYAIEDIQYEFKKKNK